MTTHGARIFVGYDGSSAADGAATWAGRTSQLRSEPLVVAIVADRMESPRRPNWPESWWVELEARAGRLGRGGRNRCQSPAPPWQSCAHVG